MMDNKLPRIRRFSKRYPGSTVLLTVFAIAVSLTILFRASFDTDVTRLIPLNAEKTALYFRVMEKFGGMEKVYILFSSDDIMGRAGEIDRAGAEILKTGLVSRASWKITEGARTYLRDVFSLKSPLLLTEEEMKEFRSRLTPDNMSRELKKTRQRMNLPGSDDTPARIDPLNLLEIFSPHMKLGDTAFDFTSGYYLTPDRRGIVMILDAKKPPRDIAFSEAFIGTLEEILSPLRAKGMNIEITGSHAITLHEASVMKKDLLSNATTSFLSVMAIFFIFFRSLKGTLFIILPALMGVIMTTALVYLFTGALSEVTGAFAGLIAGLGDDLGIVLYVSYLLNLAASPDRTEGMDRGISRTYRSITTGTITTAVVFLPMLLSSFKGVRELGLLTGMGMLVCWVLLFSITALVIKPSTGRFIEIKPLGSIASRAFRDPYPVIGLSLAVTGLLLFFIPRIPVIGDITKLGTTDNRARNVLEGLKDSYLMEPGIFITGSGEDLESALARSLEIKKGLSPDLPDLHGPADMLPPLSDQERNLRVLDSLDPRKISGDFLRAAEAEGFMARDMKPFADRLEAMLRNREHLSLRDLEPVREAFDRLALQENGKWTVLLTGNPKPGAALTGLSGISHTGPSFIRQELLGILKRDALVISLAGLILVNIILFVDFRNLFHILLCQAPVVISILCTLGVMGVSGISLNFMNIIVFVLLFGIGTDYTVHLIHRYQADRDITLSFLQTGKAVFVAGLTTIAGFGSVGFSSYRGLASMGQVAAVGTAFCVIFSLTLLPALLRLSEKRTQ